MQQTKKILGLLTLLLLLVGSVSAATYIGNNQSTITGSLTVTPIEEAVGFFINQDYDEVALEIDTETTTEEAVRIVSGVQRTTSALFYILDDHSSTNQNTLQIRNDGSGDGIMIDQNGLGVALNIDTESTTQQGLNVYSNNNLDGSKPLVRFNIAAGGSSSNVVDIDNIGTGYGLEIDQDGAAIALNVDYDGAGSNSAVVIQKDGGGTGRAVYIDNNDNSTALDVDSTGEGIYIHGVDGLHLRLGNDGECRSGQYGIYNLGGDVYWCKNGVGTKLNP